MKGEYSSEITPQMIQAGVIALRPYADSHGCLALPDPAAAVLDILTAALRVQHPNDEQASTDAG